MTCDHGDLADLPSDYRSLMKTPRNIEVSNLCGGQFVYIAIANGLELCLKNPVFSQKVQAYFATNPLIEKTVKLIINVDGLPLFKSSTQCFWPILACCSASVRTPPFLVALFCGNGKPNSLDDFMSSFFDEYDCLSSLGYGHGNERYIIKIEAFSCDMPARQFLKNIKGHTGYHACERCTIKGSIKSELCGSAEEHAHMKKNMAFLGTNCPSKSNQLFNDFAYFSKDFSKTHQIGYTILMDHYIQCVTSLTMDVMHAVFLGFVRRHLNFLTGGPRKCKLSNHQLKRLSNDLIRLEEYWPSDFQHRPRGLDTVSR